DLPRPLTVKKEPPAPPPVTTPPVNAPPVTAPPPSTMPPNVLAVPPGLLKQPAPAPAEKKPQTPAQPQPSPSSTAVYAVQVGAFANQKSAEEIALALKRQFPDTFVDASMGDRVLYRVRVGRFPDAASARPLMQQLRAAG